MLLNVWEGYLKSVRFDPSILQSYDTIYRFLSTLIRETRPYHLAKELPSQQSLKGILQLRQSYLQYLFPITRQESIAGAHINRLELHLRFLVRLGFYIA